MGKFQPQVIVGVDVTALHRLHRNRLPGSLFGIRQEAHRRHGNDHRHNCRNPDAGLFIAEHIFDSGFHAVLPEGHGAGGHRVSGGGAGQQGVGIGLPLRIRQVRHGPFVAGHFQIPAEKNVRNPHQRLEPVDRQQDKPKGLPPVVPVAQMGPLVPQNVGPVLRFHVRGKVDSRPDDSQQEGAGNGITQVDILPQPKGGTHPAGQAEVTHQRVHQHPRHANQPDYRRHRQQNLHGVDAGYGDRGQIFRNYRIHRPVHGGNAAVNGGLWGQGDVHGHRVLFGDQAQGTLHRNGESQPQCNQRPQIHRQTFGHLPQKQPQSQHCQNQITRG